jgi:hypothetical protein
MSKFFAVFLPIFAITMLLVLFIQKGRLKVNMKTAILLIAAGLLVFLWTVGLLGRLS